MKLLNKKGFALVETLIVTVFVMTLFIFTYQNVIPMIGEYEKMYSYDDIDSIYAANLYKQVVLRYVNLNHIDTKLNTDTYVDITDCSNSDIYASNDYCSNIKKALNIREDDYIFITNYDISRFRDEVKENEFFDSGKLSNFKSYVNTLGDLDSFYDPTDTSQPVSGKYRLFMTRTVTNSDQTTTLKYANLGIFLGDYQRYNSGEKVVFNPGDGEREFYVLHDSSSNQSTVTLISDSNLEGTTVFNTTGTSNSPTNALTLLNTKTTNWNNVIAFTSSDTYTANGGYTISYNGYKARLLNKNDIHTLLGCSSEDGCFNVDNLFVVTLDTRFNWLYANLKEREGYWLADSVVGTNMAWSIQNGLVKPVLYDNSNKDDLYNIGVRPVIVVSKDKLSVGDK